MLTLLSSLKSANDKDNGSSGGVKCTAAAGNQQVSEMKGRRDLPLYTTTLGAPNTDLTLAKALTTALVLDKSVGMCSCSEVLSDSFVDREAKATLYPCDAKTFAVDWPILAPAPRMRTTGDGDMLIAIHKREIVTGGEVDGLNAVH